MIWWSSILLQLLIHVNDHLNTWHAPQSLQSFHDVKQTFTFKPWTIKPLKTSFTTWPNFDNIKWIINFPMAKTQYIANIHIHVLILQRKNYNSWSQALCIYISFLYFLFCVSISQSIVSKKTYWLKNVWSIFCHHIVS